MDFIEEIRNLSTRIEKQKDVIQTEEATKNAFIMPFINLLGYNVFDPTEVVPEFTADVGTKQGEKVDYAIFKDDEVIILIECKKYGSDLTDVHTSQLYRYFSVVHARIAVLTDGVVYRVYTDLEESNKMDTKPFLEFNMLDIQPPLVNELKRFTKSAFNLDATLTAASDLKYTKEIKQIMVIQQFTDIVKRALNQFLNEQINQRLQSAIERGEALEESVEVEGSDESIDEEVESRIVTTEEELEGFYIAKSIVREAVAPDRIGHRDTINYMSVLPGDNRRRPICRLHLNSAKKYIGLFNEEGKHERFEIESVDDIYEYAEQLKVTAQRYDAPAVSESSELQ